jgi:hypothetical protein
MGGVFCGGVVVFFEGNEKKVEEILNKRTKIESTQYQ